jgi:hypothetical protein
MFCTVLVPVLKTQTDRQSTGFQQYSFIDKGKPFVPDLRGSPTVCTSRLFSLFCSVFPITFFTTGTSFDFVSDFPDEDLSVVLGTEQ